MISNLVVIAALALFAGEWKLDGNDPSRGAYSGTVVVAPTTTVTCAIAGTVRFASGATERLRGQGTLASDRLLLELGGSGIASALAGGGAAPVRGEWTAVSATRLEGSRGPARDALERIAEGPRTLLPIERLDGGPEPVPQVHSNHPEIVTATDDAHAIAVSTLRGAGRAHPDAHLGQPLSGRFKVFASHQNRTGRELHRAIVLVNEGAKKVVVRVRALASVDTREAPYDDLTSEEPRVILDPAGTRASGPGEAAASRITRGLREGPDVVEVAPGATRLLHVARHRQGVELVTMADLESDGPIAVAILYDGARPDEARAAHLLAVSGRLALSAKDPVATAPGATGSFVFGRVAGVVKHASFAWRFTNDRARRSWLAVPGTTARFALDTKKTNTLGTGVDDAAPLLARYPGSAYASHGNYGAALRVEARLRNPLDETVRVSVFVDSVAGKGSSRWLRNVFEVVTSARAFVHVSLVAGQESRTPLATVELPPRAERTLAIRLDYAANNTPPHVLRIVTSR